MKAHIEWFNLPTDEHDLNSASDLLHGSFICGDAGYRGAEKREEMPGEARNAEPPSIRMLRQHP